MTAVTGRGSAATHGRIRNGVRADHGPASTSWPGWGGTVQLTVSRGGDDIAQRAGRLVRRELAALERAAALRRGDAEIHRLYRAAGAPLRISPRLARAVAAALSAAERTAGDVDPTVGAAVLSLEHSARRGRDLATLPVCSGAGPVTARPAPGWRVVRLDGLRLSVPAGVSLDLTAVLAALAADTCAEMVTRTFATGALVMIGRDIASAGPAPDGGWQVNVEGRPAGGRSVRLPGGLALSTSAPSVRHPGQDRATHRVVVDPRTGRQVDPLWRTVSVVARTAVEAHADALATVVRGHAGLPALAAAGAPARLVTPCGDVVTTVRWPGQDAVRAGDVCAS